MIVLCNSVTYLRLDGSVEPEKRYEIVKAFNSDPTIDVLLLTTHGKYAHDMLASLVYQSFAARWLCLPLAWKLLICVICSWWTWIESYIS